MKICRSMIRLYAMAAPSTDGFPSATWTCSARRGTGCRNGLGIVFFITLFTATAVAEIGKNDNNLNSETSYTVQFRGVDGDLLELLRRSSAAVTHQDDSAVSEFRLRRRLADDVNTFRKAFRSRGFYAGEVDAELIMDKGRAKVVYLVNAGPRYTISRVQVKLPTGYSEELRARLLEIAALPVYAGAAADARDVISAERQLVSRLEELGYPWAAAGDRSVQIDHDATTMDIVYELHPGPLAHFGPSDIIGLERVEELFVRRRIDWDPGTPYDQRKVARTRSMLIASGLFTTVRIVPAEQLSADGLLPITIQLAERKPRAVLLGAQYSTDEGAGITAGWEHMNLFGQGEKLAAEITFSEQRLAAESSYTIRDFRRLNQELEFRSWITNEDREAYSSRRLGVAAQIARKLHPGLIVGGGSALTISDVEAAAEQDSSRFFLLSFPVFMRRDSSDNALDPSRGNRINLQLTPFFNLESADNTFIKGYVNLRHYLQPSAAPALVLATRAVLGGSGGTSRDQIPADERFYAGGGGSVRGYTYQTVGPLLDNEPLGGRSLLEVSVELRYRITETFGCVAFVDGGTAYESTVPDFAQSLRWGAGVGLRYFTRIGPLRLDVAVPLNRRSEIDDTFQVYLSIGQAF